MEDFAPSAVINARIFNDENFLITRLRCCRPWGGELATNHVFSKFFLICLTWNKLGHSSTATHHRNAICNRHNLVEFMRDEDDGEAIGSQNFEVFKEFIHFLRNQNCSWFIENEDLCATKEHLCNLYTLAKSNTKVCDKVIRIDVEAIGLNNILQVCTCFGIVHDDLCLHWFTSQNYVLKDGGVICQHKVLVNHADTKSDGILR